LNILDGGFRISGCPVPETGGVGTSGLNCRMTPQQVRDYARVLATGCALLMWRYDADYMASRENQAAFQDVLSMLSSVPQKSCRRR
jgi:hypothetical protein